MKFKILIIIGILSFSASVNAQSLKWSDNTADILEQGRKETGIFSPLKIGLKNSKELSIHPILFFIIPNASIKKQWKANDKYRFSSLHKFTYPTMLYKMLSRKGTGGVLPSTSKIPQMFKFNNAALLSIDKFNQTFTFSLGVDLSLNFGESDFTYIEWHMVYPRTYALNNIFTPYAGVDVTGKLYKNFVYDYKFNAYYLARTDAGFVTENSFKITWQKSDKFAIKAGAIYSYGKFPFGNDGGLYPTFDLMFGF